MFFQQWKIMSHSNSLTESSEDQLHTAGWGQGGAARGHGNHGSYLVGQGPTLALLASGQASSQRDVFSHTVQVWPLCAVGGVTSHTLFFFWQELFVCPRYFWQSPQVLQFPRFSQKQNHHGQVQIRTSMKLSQTCCNSGRKRPCGERP